jgi:hypothetical protein
MKTKTVAMPVFKHESDEADWWASREGRGFVKRKSAESAAQGKKPKGSTLVAQLNKASMKGCSAKAVIPTGVAVD